MNTKNIQRTAAQAQRFATIIIKLVIRGNTQRAKKYLLAAEQIFCKGNEEVRNTILRVYMFSVSGFIKMHHCSIKNLVPQMFRNEYNKQQNNTRVCLS